MIEQVLTLPPLIDTVAITAGALSGALHATRRDLDAVGILAVSICTAIGGGAIRDVVLQVGIPTFLVAANYFAYAALGAVAGYFFAGLVRTWVPVLVMLDSLLIGVWVVIGAEKTLAADLSVTTAVFLALVTATGGGVLRDLLCRETPAVLQPGQYYALAALISAVVFVAALSLGLSVWWAQGLAVAVATGLRFVSMRVNLRTPVPTDLTDRITGLRWRWRRRDEPA